MKLNFLGLIFLTLCLCFSEGVSFAQENTDYDVYMESSNKNAILFRGRRAFYYNIRYNGHCYWMTPEFQNGDIVYNGKHYYDVLLNFDAYRGEVLVKSSSAVMAIALSSDEVERFTIGVERFERPTATKKKSFYPDGFYQILYQDNTTTVYKKVIKTFTSNTNNNNGPAIGYDDPNYDPAVINFFQYNGKYFLAKDGVLKKIGKGKARKIAGRV